MKNTMRYISLLFALVLVVSLVACAPASTQTPAAPTDLPPAEPTAIPTSPEVATKAPSVAPTEAASRPEPKDGVERISFEDFKALFDSGKSMTILDARARESYQLGHIQGAISLPWKPELTMADVEELSQNKSIITYCDCGPGEADGADVARQLIKMGFKDVKTLAHPSIDGWIEKGYPTQ